MIELKDLYSECNDKKCLPLIKGFIKPGSNYINYTENFRAWQAAIIDLQGLTLDDYCAKQKKKYGGNILRQTKKAFRKGYYCRPFDGRIFLPDIVEINQSMPERQRGPMKGHYNETVEQKGGYPKKYYEFSLPRCLYHYTIMYGCFIDKPGHRQGNIPVNKKLVAYINLHRIGNIAFYSMILGHGEHLKNGIMYQLHLFVLEWLLNKKSILFGSYSDKLDYLMYTAMKSGTAGLQQWKRVCLFEPENVYYEGSLSHDTD